jgi:uncharacterized membrane protein YgdD (TMEM256/DUF423 family)
LRQLVVAGGVLAALAIAAGAFGAHALAGRLSPERLVTWETAARYHMYGALSIVLVGIAAARWTSSLVTLAGWILVVGTLIFAGTVYALALGAPRWLGAVTPLGGLGLIIGWAVFSWAVWRSV